MDERCEIMRRDMCASSVRASSVRVGSADASKLWVNCDPIYYEGT
jgi:hypothetical protein